MPTITIDDVQYEVTEGRTILQAIDDLGLLMNGIDIPHYCWHPKLSIDGSCRLCQVEVEGLPKLQIACNTPVKDGMVVRTQGEVVQRAREGVMELLLVNHPLDCPICDQAGECKLQDYAFEYGLSHARTEEPRRALKKRYDIGPTILLDQERCILCRRCVRFCREVPGTSELAVFSRADTSVIDLHPGTELDNDYSMNVADICPVGALTTKDFRFKVRVWFLEDVPGVCTGCSNGCNIHMGVSNNKVHRYVPRRNDEVNETWMCDEGRLSYKAIHSQDRLREIVVRRGDGRREVLRRDQAVTWAAARLRGLIDARGAGVVGGVASAHATNEDLFVFERFLSALGIENRGCPVPTGDADDLLIKAEKAANASGARALGFGDPGPLLDRLRGGGLSALIVLGHDLLGAGFLDGDTAPLEALETLIVIDTQPSALQTVADLVIPGRHAAEKLGTLTNHQGRVQRVSPAVEPPFEAYAEGDILTQLGDALGLPGFDDPWDAGAVSKRLSQEVGVFSGCDVEAVGPNGRLPGAGGH